MKSQCDTDDPSTSGVVAFRNTWVFVGSAPMRRVMSSRSRTATPGSAALIALPTASVTVRVPEGPDYSACTTAPGPRSRRARAARPTMVWPAPIAKPAATSLGQWTPR